MKKCVFGFLIMIFLLAIPKPAECKILSAQGEILRFYETHLNDWSSSVLIKDSFNKELTFYIHPKITAIRRGVQMEDVGQLTGGMKVTILYRVEKDKKAYASVIQINGALRV